MYRKVLFCALAVGVVSLVPGHAAAQQQYPPPPCTPEERVAFNQAQREEKQAFRAEQKERRRNFQASGPHTAEEKREFNQREKERAKDFAREQRQERKAFRRGCFLSRPHASGPTGLSTPSSRPAFTVGHLFLVVAAVLSFLLVRGVARTRARR